MAYCSFRNEMTKVAEPVLFVQFTLKSSGSPISGLMVVDALREAGFGVHAVYHQSGDLLPQYEEKCIAVSQIDHGRWLSGGPWHRRFRRLLSDMKAAREFVKLIREIKPRLVYVNNLTGLAAALAARRAGIPCVWHVRELFDDVEGEMHPPWPGGKLLARCLIARCATRVVVISRAVQENVLGTWCRNRTILIPNAVDDSFFQESRCQEEARRALGLPLGRPVVGVPGTLRPVKGHDFFLRALAQVRQQISNIFAAFAGDGDPKYRQKLEEMVADLNLREHVRFLATVTDMPAFYRACDVICVPSRSESFGRTAIEAMAVGTPVVATAVGGLPEIVQHDVTGLLVPYGEVQSLTSCLAKLLNDRCLVSRLAFTSRGKVEEAFSPVTYCNRLSHMASQFIIERQLHGSRIGTFASVQEVLSGE